MALKIYHQDNWFLRLYTKQLTITDSGIIPTNSHTFPQLQTHITKIEYK